MKKDQFLQSGSLSESRRQFLEKAGLATIIGTFGISFFTSCVSSEEPDDTTTPPTTTAYVALTSVCTHSQCFDSWAFTNNQFTCTCHNSIFDTAGKVVQGPAGQPLDVYSTSVSGSTLTINK